MRQVVRMHECARFVLKQSINNRQALYDRDAHYENLRRCFILSYINPLLFIASKDSSSFHIRPCDGHIP